MGNVEFDDTYLDIIAAAKIDISRGVDSAVRGRNIWKFCRKSAIGKGDFAGGSLLSEARDAGQAGI